MTNGWVVAAWVLTGCKAARDYAVERYDQHRAAEVKAEDVAAREEAERPPTPRPDGAGLAPGTYRVQALRVATFATTARNRAWDDAPGAEPDLQVTVTVDGKRIARCKPADDRFEGDCAFAELEFEITDASTISFDVIDRDSLLDDPIGTATLADPSTWGTGIAMQLVPQRRLKSASITLAAVPTWWDLHGTKVLIWGGIGIVVTGGLIALGNRRAKPRSDAKRCAACGARLANYARCSDCGAEQGVS